MPTVSDSLVESPQTGPAPHSESSHTPLPEISHPPEPGSEVTPVPVDSGMAMVPGLQPVQQVTAVSGTHDYLVAADASGNSLISWLGAEQSIYVRGYDSKGQPQGPEYHFNKSRVDTGGGLALASAAAGKFLLVSRSQALLDATDQRLNAVFLDSSGQPVGTGFSFTHPAHDPNLATPTIALLPYGSVDSPTIAHEGPGRLLFVWKRRQISDFPYNLVARRYDSDGHALGEEFQLSERELKSFAVASNATAQPVLVFLQHVGGLKDSIGHPVEGTRSVINVQRYDDQSKALGEPTQIEIHFPDFLAKSEAKPALAMAANGAFLVSWRDLSSLPGSLPSTSSQAVFVQRFDPEGNQLGKPIEVNPPEKATGTDPLVASQPQGAFGVLWAATDQNIYLQSYDRLGQALGTAFQVNASPCDEGAGFALSADPHGYLISWRGKDGGLYARRYLHEE
ncbi:MAG: hypothetical protein ACAI44_26925 [Candidatus Sericytochromatia bacterium]